MKIDISKLEAKELRSILEHYESDLRVEIRHTKSTPFKTRLTREKKIIERLMEKIKVL